MKNEEGYILALSLIMMMVLTIVGLASIQAAIHETKIAGNLLLQKQAFQASESGWEITRTKLEALDTDPTSTTWTVTEISDSPIRFRAVATHVLNINKDGKQTVKTTAGKPIYRIESDGYEKESHQITEVVVALRPSLDIPAALYTHTDPLINSDKATVSGIDQCGSNSKYGIVTTGNLVTIKNGTVEGFPDHMETNSGIKIDIPEFIDALKSSANYTNPPQNDKNSPKFL
jgi:hypothetical protein